MYSVSGMRLVTRAAAAAAAAGVASLAYQTIAEARDRRRFPPPGRLVDIGGRRLHLMTAGEGSPRCRHHPGARRATSSGGCASSRAPLPRRRPASTTGRRSGGATRLLTGGGRLTSWPPTCTRCCARPVSRRPTSWSAIRSAASSPAVSMPASGPGGGDAAGGFQPRTAGRRFAALDWRRGPVMYCRVAMQRQARVLGILRLAASVGLVRGLDAEIAREAPPEYAGRIARSCCPRGSGGWRSGKWLMAAFMEARRRSSIPFL